MAEINGKMLICDICGKSIFLKHTGTHHEAQYGGFGSYEEYEKPPEGWDYSPIVFDGVKNVCPNCSAPLNEFDKKLKEEVRAVEEKWHNMMKENIRTGRR